MHSAYMPHPWRRIQCRASQAHGSHRSSTGGAAWPVAHMQGGGEGGERGGECAGAGSKAGRQAVMSVSHHVMHGGPGERRREVLLRKALWAECVLIVFVEGPAACVGQYEAASTSSALTDVCCCAVCPAQETKQARDAGSMDSGHCY
jgi:hypothetical protein